MMTLIYAPPSWGKTLAAFAAHPNAAIATPKLENITEPAKLYGIDINPDLVCEVSSTADVAKFFARHKDRPRMIDDLSDLLDKEHGPLDRQMGSPASYGELNKRVIPYLRALSERSEHPTLITAWAREPAIAKDVAGDKGLQPGSWAAPGAKMRATVPGLCTHYLRVRAQEPARSAWPFEFQTTADNLWQAKCRAPASVPPTLPLALSEIYRAAGYDCAALFPDQGKVRDTAYKILTGEDQTKARDQLSKVFTKAVSDGANPHAVAYAVTEAQARIALEEHQANLVTSLVGNFF